MGEIFKRIAEWASQKIGERVRVPRAIGGILLILAATCIYVLCNRPYIAIPGSNISIRLGEFEQCEITFKNNLHFNHYGILHDTDSIVVNEEIQLQPLHYIGSTLTVTNLWYLRDHTATNATHLYSLDIFTDSSTVCEITGISVDGEPMSLRDFFKHNLKNEKREFERFRYIRKDLAGIIYRWNDEASNWILTGLAAGIVLFLLMLIGMELRIFVSDKRFLKGLEKRLRIKITPSSEIKQRDEAYDRFHDLCLQWNSWFVFLQALGPALGFILTVSSLIASLDPATFSGSGTDLDAFLNGIHVAMVSTFLGLLLRLLALEAARVNLSLLRRAYVTLSAGMIPVEKETSDVQKGVPRS